MGYHVRDIKIRGEYGNIEKIEEELDELKEAIEQGNKILILVELSDLYGSIRGFVEKNFSDITMYDVETMSAATHRAFLDGSRTPSDLSDELQKNFSDDEILLMRDKLETISNSIKRETGEKND